jgi:hypothetical protein
MTNLTYLVAGRIDYPEGVTDPEYPVISWMRDDRCFGDEVEAVAFYRAMRDAHPSVTWMIFRDLGDRWEMFEA